MVRLTKKNLAQFLEVGRQLFDLTQSGRGKSNSSRQYHCAMVEDTTSCSLDYEDSTITVSNRFVDLETANAQTGPQGPYRIEAYLTEVLGRRDSSASVATVFSCEFYGAPEISDWLKRKIHQITPKKFRVNPNPKRIRHYVFKPGKWIEHVSGLLVPRTV